MSLKHFANQGYCDTHNADRPRMLPVIRQMLSVADNAITAGSRISSLLYDRQGRHTAFRTHARNYLLRFSSLSYFSVWMCRRSIPRQTYKQTNNHRPRVYNSTVTGVDRGEAVVTVSRKCNQCRREKQCDFSFPLEIIMYNIV